MALIKSVADLAHGSLGTIYKSEEGHLYTHEYYASRFWFETKTEAVFFLQRVLESHSYMRGEAYLEDLEPIEIREEWTVKINYDLVQMRMNDIRYGV